MKPLNRAVAWINDPEHPERRKMLSQQARQASKAELGFIHWETFEVAIDAACQERKPDLYPTQQYDWFGIYWCPKNERY